MLHTDLGENLKPEDLLVASASDDGTVKLWHPLQVTNSHFCIFFINHLFIFYLNKINSKSDILNNSQRLILGMHNIYRYRIVDQLMLYI